MGCKRLVEGLGVIGMGWMGWMGMESVRRW